MSLWQTLLVIDIVIAIYDWMSYIHINICVNRDLKEIDDYVPNKISFIGVAGYILSFILGTIVFLVPGLNLWIAYGAAVNKERAERMLLINEYESFLKKKQKEKTKEDLDNKNILNKEGDK